MGAVTGIPMLLLVAGSMAERIDEKVQEITELIETQGGQTVLCNALRHCTVELEVLAVGVFSLFESRNEERLSKEKRFENLSNKIRESGEVELGDRLWQFYLAVNVLKHGRGPSYNKLVEMHGLPFEVKMPGLAFFDEGDISEPEGLINVTGTGFFADLIDTLQRANQFLDEADP